jgi:hypothetical protein
MVRHSAWVVLGWVVLGGGVVARCLCVSVSLFVCLLACFLLPSPDCRLHTSILLPETVEINLFEKSS